MCPKLAWSEEPKLLIVLDGGGKRDRGEESADVGRHWSNSTRCILQCGKEKMFSYHFAVQKSPPSWGASPLLQNVTAFAAFALSPHIAQLLFVASCRWMGWHWALWYGLGYDQGAYKVCNKVVSHLIKHVLYFDKHVGKFVVIWRCHFHAFLVSNTLLHIRGLAVLFGTPSPSRLSHLSCNHMCIAEAES